MRGPTQELVDYIAAYEAEDGVTARDILVLRRNLAPGLSSVIVAPVLSLRTVICVRCVSAAGVPVHNIELDQQLGCVAALVDNPKVVSFARP
jgi:hypothetical protein